MMFCKLFFLFPPWFTQTFFFYYFAILCPSHTFFLSLSLSVAPTRQRAMTNSIKAAPKKGRNLKKASDKHKEPKAKNKNQKILNLFENVRAPALMPNAILLDQLGPSGALSFLLGGYSVGLFWASSDTCVCVCLAPTFWGAELWHMAHWGRRRKFLKKKYIYTCVYRMESQDTAGGENMYNASLPHYNFRFLCCLLAFCYFIFFFLYFFWAGCVVYCSDINVFMPSPRPPMWTMWL